LIEMFLPRLIVSSVGFQVIFVNLVYNSALFLVVTGTNVRKELKVIFRNQIFGFLAYFLHLISIRWSVT